jgi:hypothetical protein
MQFLIQPGRVYAREDLDTNGTTAVSLSPSVFVVAAGGDDTGGGKNDTPRFAVVTCESNNIRYTRNGTTPVEASLTGAVLTPTSALPLVLTGEAQIRNFRFVAVAAGAAKVHVDYYR